MTFKGVFIDDQDALYAETLSTSGVLDISFMGIDEVTNLVRTIGEHAPMIAALDYRLDEVPGPLRQDQTYKGSALAQHLRDAAIEYPASDFAIVLVSAETKIRALYKPDVTAHDLFDRVYVKEQINAARQTVRNELVSLCRGYTALRLANLVYDPLKLLGASDAESGILSHQELRTRFERAKAPHILARTILNLLIDRPGPLIDDFELCARLGIAHDGLKHVVDAARAQSIAYDGIFSDGWSRWWAGRLDQWSRQIFGRRPTGIPASERATILSEAIGHALTPAVSPWDGSTEELIALSCASCRRGTEIRHSVAVFEPALPRFVERRRICWDCVRTDKFEATQPALVVDEMESDIVEAIRSNRVESAG